MAVKRLSKVAREFNVGIATIVDYLHGKGSKISSDPNTKLTDEDYALVAKAFSSDSQVKKESSSIDLKTSRKKKETISIDESGNVSTEQEEAPVEKEFISVKDEVKLTNNIKIVDHIDLDAEHKPAPVTIPVEVEKPQPAPQEEKKVEAPVEEKIIEPKKEEKPEIIEKKQPEPVKKQEEPEEEEEPMNEKTSKETTFKVTQPAIKDVKVVGTIDPRRALA